MDRINSIGQLKLYLTEVVITILFVQFLEIVIVNGDHLLDWQAIILPVAILCLAGAIYLMQAGHTDEDKNPEVLIPRQVPGRQRPCRRER